MNKFIRVGKELVKVSEDLYKEYYKMTRRSRYLEKDVKVGSIEIVNKENNTYVFHPSKEDSIERLMDKGEDFESEKRIEDIVCDKAMLLILNTAIAELDKEEQEIIKEKYWRNKTFREIGELKKVSHTAIRKRHEKVIGKLKKYF